MDNGQTDQNKCEFQLKFIAQILSSIDNAAMTHRLETRLNAMEQVQRVIGTERSAHDVPFKSNRLPLVSLNASNLNLMTILERVWFGWLKNSIDVHRHRLVKLQPINKNNENPNPISNGTEKNEETKLHWLLFIAFGMCVCVCCCCTRKFFCDILIIRSIRNASVVHRSNFPFGALDG